MEVKNCKLCGRMYNDTKSSSICPACDKKMEEKFSAVKDYIRENPNAAMTQIAEDNEVPVQQLKKWIREERLQFSKDSGVKLSCESCGAEILTGRFCKACKRQMQDKLTGLYVEPVAQKKAKRDSNGRMRFLN